MGNDKALAEVPMGKEKIELIKKTVALGATDTELELFLYTAKQTGLDPLTRQIHFVKRKTRMPDGSYADRMTIQTGIDGYRAIAERTGTLAGIDDAIFDDEKNAWPGKASVTVYRMINGVRVGFTASARWSEYAQIYNGKPGAMWAKMPYLMLSKCAEALALRKAFPNDLSGIYTQEEMQQADNTEAPANNPESIKPVIEIVPTAGVKNGDAFIAGLEADQAKELAPEPEKSKARELMEKGMQEVGATPTPTPSEYSEFKHICPHCKTGHNGQYPKCISCWRAGKK